MAIGDYEALRAAARENADLSTTQVLAALVLLRELRAELAGLGTSADRRRP